jgi:hypothetical protein
MSPHLGSDSSKLADELEKYRRQFEAIETEARDILDGLTDAQLAWQPEPRVTGRQSLSYVAEAVDAGRIGAMLSAGPFRYGILERWVVWLMEPPARLKFAAARAYRPASRRPGAVVVDEFLRLQHQLRQSLQQVNGLDLAKVKVRNPVSGWIKFSLGQEFAFTAAHERRHIWQMRQIKAHRAFRGVC